MEENKSENTLENKGQNNNQKQIAGAIIMAGLLIAGAVLLKGNTSLSPGNTTDTNNKTANVMPARVGAVDRTLGSANAKVALVMYEDFQCPWCGKFDKESEKTIRDSYVKDGRVQLVFRDFPFLGDGAKQRGLEDESTKAAEAARCAGDQGKFWDYHDYLFANQNGENQGNFSIAKLKSFAGIVGLDKTSFAQCLDTDKYAKAVADSKNEGALAGVIGTPKGFILKNGKVVDTIDGYVTIQVTTQKLDAALK